MKKGTCSRALFFIMDREFGRPQDNEERAAELLAGGIAQQGDQCGLLWGAVDPHTRQVNESVSRGSVRFHVLTKDPVMRKPDKRKTTVIGLNDLGPGLRITCRNESMVAPIGRSLEGCGGKTQHVDNERVLRNNACFSGLLDFGGVRYL